MSTLKTIHGNKYAGHTIIMPIVGQVTFNDDGTLDVPDEHADNFIAATVDSFGFSDADAKKKGKLTKAQLEKLEQDEEALQTEAELAKLDTTGLLELAAEASLGKPEDIAKMSDAVLRKKLAKKLAEAKKE